MAKRKESEATSEEIKQVSMNTILNVLKGEKEFDDKTQLAMKFLNYESRQEHIQQAKAKFRYTLVKSLADPDIMKKYVMASDPQIKKLPA